MGIITNITDEYDDEEEQHVIHVRTHVVKKNISVINRVASRASVMTGVSQRMLVAAASDEYDLVWKEGPFDVDALDKFEEAKDIEFELKEVTSDSSGLELKGPQLLHTWRIPYKLA